MKRNNDERVFYDIGAIFMCFIGGMSILGGLKSLGYGGQISLFLILIGILLININVKKIKKCKEEQAVSKEEQAVSKEEQAVSKEVQGVDEEIKERGTVRTIISVVLAVVAATGIILGLVSFIFRFTIAGIMVGYIALMVWIKDKKQVKRMVITLGLYCFIMSFFQVISLHSTNLWIYPFQSAYIDTLRNVTEPDWFPDEWEDVVSDFHFDYCMSWMDPGDYVVSYNTTSEHILELEEIYAPMAEKAKAEAYERDGNNAVYKYNNRRVKERADSLAVTLVTSDFKEFLEMKDVIRKETGDDKLEYYKVYIIDYKDCHYVYNGNEHENSKKCGVLIIDVVEESNGEMTCRIEFNSQ